MVSTSPPPKSIRQSTEECDPDAKADNLRDVVHPVYRETASPQKMEDGLRHRPSTPLSDSEIAPEPVQYEDPPAVDEEDEIDMRTSCRWCPLLVSTAMLIYIHGVALGWWLRSK